MQMYIGSDEANHSLVKVRGTQVRILPSALVKENANIQYQQVLTAGKDQHYNKTKTGG